MNHLYLIGAAAILAVLLFVILILIAVKLFQVLSVGQKQKIEHMAARAVLLIEQQAKEYFESPTGQEKRKLALDLLASWLSRSMRLKFTAEQLEAFIQEGFDESGLKHEVEQVQTKVEAEAKEGGAVG